jgi:hypothetical protein
MVGVVTVIPSNDMVALLSIVVPALVAAAADAQREMSTITVSATFLTISLHVY